MVFKQKQKAILPNLVTLGDATYNKGSNPAPVSPAKLIKRSTSLIEARFDLTGVVISLTAANDYGGTNLADLPNTNMLIAGAMIDAVATMAGFASNVGTTLDISLGSVVASNATLASTMMDYVEKIDATGAGATATIKGHSFDNASVAPDLIFRDAATTNDFFVNASCPVTSGTGTVTFTSGFASLFYWDLLETS